MFCQLVLQFTFRLSIFNNHPTCINRISHFRTVNWKLKFKTNLFPNLQCCLELLNFVFEIGQIVDTPGARSRVVHVLVCVMLLKFFRLRKTSHARRTNESLGRFGFDSCAVDMTLAGKSFLRWKIALCLGAKQTSVHQIMLLSCELSPFYFFHIFSNKLIPIKKIFHHGMNNTFGREFS